MPSAAPQPPAPGNERKSNHEMVEVSESVYERLSALNRERIERVEKFLAALGNLKKAVTELHGHFTKERDPILKIALQSFPATDLSAISSLPERKMTEDLRKISEPLKIVDDEVKKREELRHVFDEACNEVKKIIKALKKFPENSLSCIGFTPKTLAAVESRIEKIRRFIPTKKNEWEKLFPVVVKEKDQFESLLDAIMKEVSSGLATISESDDDETLVAKEDVDRETEEERRASKAALQQPSSTPPPPTSAAGTPRTKETPVRAIKRADEATRALADHTWGDASPELLDQISRNRPHGELVSRIDQIKEIDLIGEGALKADPRIALLTDQEFRDHTARLTRISALQNAMHEQRREIPSTDLTTTNAVMTEARLIERVNTLEAAQSEARRLFLLPHGDGAAVFDAAVAIAEPQKRKEFLDNLERIGTMQRKVDAELDSLRASYPRFLGHLSHKLTAGDLLPGSAAATLNRLEEVLTSFSTLVEVASATKEWRLDSAMIDAVLHDYTPARSLSELVRNEHPQKILSALAAFTKVTEGREESFNAIRSNPRDEEDAAYIARHAAQLEAINDLFTRRRWNQTMNIVDIIPPEIDGTIAELERVLTASGELTPA